MESRERSTRPDGRLSNGATEPVELESLLTFRLLLLLAPVVEVCTAAASQSARLEHVYSRIASGSPSRLFKEEDGGIGGGSRQKGRKKGEEQIIKEDKLWT